MRLLIKYWFEFETTQNVISRGLQIGCGVTSFSYADALQLIKKKIFEDGLLPQITNYVENVDVRTLDRGHVIPNIMWSPSERGIWFPQGYHDNF